MGLAALSIVDAAQLTIPLIIEKAVDSLAMPQTGAASITRYGIMLAGLGVVMSIFRFVWRWFLLGAARRVEQKLRNEFFAHLQRLPIDFFSTRKTGDLMAHAVNDIEAIRMACGLGLVIAYDGVILLVLILAAMFYISPKLTMYAFLPFPVLGIMIYAFGRVIEKRFSGVQESFSNMTESARESLSGIKAVKAFVRERQELGEFTSSSRDYVAKNMKLIRYIGVYRPLIVFISGIATAIFLLVGGRGAIFMNITLGDFAAVLVYLGMLSWPMMALGWAVDIIKRGNASLKRVNEIMSIEPEQKDAPGAISVSLTGDIRFKDVSYSYNGVPRTLDGISFHIPAGKAFGITGATGAGKTTLLKLLLRIEEIECGKVLLNDTLDIRDIKIECLRRGIVYVPQETTVFSGTIRDNISFMNPEISGEQVEEAAKLTQIYDDIASFPDGFDTTVGERGLTLSGGQRQRLALARALLMNPQVLVLDDVLSSLDLETESKVLQNLRKTMSGRTLVAVSSRVPSISGFDTIAVMEDGKLAEIGAHGELIEKDGIYARLYNVQVIE